MFWRKLRRRAVGAGALLLLGMFAGCGEEAKEAAAETEEEYVYAADYAELDTGEYSINGAVFGKGEMMYLLGNSEKGGTKLFSLNISEALPAELPVEIAENGYVSGMGSDSDGNLLAGFIQNSQNAESDGVIEAVELKRISEQGEILESVDVSAALAKIPELYIQNIICDKEGNYFVCGNQSVYVIKSSGDLLCEISADTYISHMFSVSDGSVMIAYFGNAGWEMKKVDISKKGLSDVESSILFDYGTYQSGADTDLLYTQDTILYSCNLKDEKPTEILNWVDSDIDSNNLRAYKILEDGRVVAFSIDWSSEEAASELAVLTKKPRSEVKEKKVLVYGTMYLPYFANRDIVAFNKQSDEYRIEVRQYGDDNTDYETMVSLMTADISSADGADIIDMAYSPVSLEELLSMGVLEDLNPYLEKDAELKRENFIENALVSYERDNKLYAIMSAFGVNTVVGKVSDVGNGKTWTVGEVIKLMDSKPKEAELLQYCSKSSVLQLMCSMNMSNFVDEESGECNFTSEAFKEILEFSNRFPKEVNYDVNGPSEIERIRNGELILYSTQLTSVQLYQMYEYMFGEEVNFIGYPTAGGSGSTIISNGTTVGMNANSKNKEGVWEFIRFNLMQERQEKVQSANGSFPIDKAAFEAKIAKDMEAEYYEDTDGTQKELPKSTWGDGNFSVEVFAATKEQVDRVKEIIETAGHTSADSKMFEIINEEAQPYFEGQKSAEDVTALIQNRVQTYVAETR